MDDADVSQARMEAEQERLQVSIRARGRETEPKGYCQNPRCEDDFPEGDQRIYCDARCAEEHVLYLRNLPNGWYCPVAQAANKRNGRG